MKLTGTPEKEGKFKFTLFVQCYGTNVSGDSGQIAYDLEVVSSDYNGSDLYTDQENSYTGSLSLEEMLNTDFDLKFD
jgi:hypothetical protein